MYILIGIIFSEGYLKKMYKMYLISKMGITTNVEIASRGLLPQFPDLYKRLYERLFKIKHSLVSKTLEDIANEGAMGRLFIIDGKALEATSSEQDYRATKQKLIGYLKSFRSGQSYGNVALNEVGDIFLSILEYIELLDKKFNTAPKRVEELRLAAIRTFREKVDFGAWRFIPAVYMGLYKRVEAELERPKTE